MKFLVILGLFLAQQTVFANGLAPASRLMLKSGQIFSHPYPKNWFANEDLLKVLAEVNSTPDLRREAKKLVEINHGKDTLIEFNLMLASQKALEIESLVEQANDWDSLTFVERKRVADGLTIIFTDLPYIFEHSEFKAVLAKQGM